MNLTINATYCDGVLVPQRLLNLPENTLVQVEITTVEPKTTKRKSLFGAFPELVALADVDYDAKQLWHSSIEKQLDIIQS